MDLDRREFLGVAAASPLAAKEFAKRAMEEAQMQASGISIYSDSLYTGIPASDPMPDMRSLREAIGVFGIPVSHHRR